MTDPRPDNRGQHRLLLGAAIAFLAVLILRTAWISDDAQITFRVLENFREGFGLVWNPGERVQVYTHPLWMLLLLIAQSFTHELYLTPILLGLLLSIAAVAIVAFRLGREGGGIIAVLALSFSSAFVDYSTGGLENPLSHFLLAIYFTMFIQHRHAMTPRILSRLTILVALILLTRMDLILLVAPAWFVALWSCRKARPRTVSIRSLVPGAAILAAWFLFSLIYYGFLLPNSAYAKLGHGTAARDLLLQGFLYLLDSLTFDPVTLPFIACACIAAITPAQRRECAPIAIGLLLYVVYTLKIGGDFMSGRFFAAPLFAAAIIVARLPIPPASSRFAAIAAIIIVLGLASPTPTISSEAAHLTEITRWDHVRRTGIHNERYFIAISTGLANMTRKQLAEAMRKPRQPDQVRKVICTLWAGAPGRTFGTVSHIIDPVGVADPLTARLPARENPDWNVSHWERVIPDGMVETKLRGVSLYTDPGVAAFAAHLDRIVSGPLLSRERLRSIWLMNTGQLNRLVSREAYRHPSAALRRGSDWDGSRFHVLARELNLSGDAISLFWNQPLVIYLDEQMYAPRIRLKVEMEDRYTVTFLSGRQALADAVELAATKEAGLEWREVVVPAAAAEAGFDRIEVSGFDGNGGYRVGAMEPVAP